MLQNINEVRYISIIFVKEVHDFLKELKNILAFYQDLKASNTNAALASVVYVEGSSYRRMGARMLIAENGEWVGGISGGCLEGDALKRAKIAIIKSQASIIRYDTTTDDDHQIGVGLGCNGIIDVLFKPIDFDDKANPLEVLKAVLEPFSEPKKFITFTKTKEKELLGSVFSLNGGIPIPASQLEKVKAQDGSQKIELDEESTIFFEVVPPSIELVLLGHQYDIYPLISLCTQLGWQSSVVAPSSKVKGISTFSPENIADYPWHAQSAAILMSHSLLTDKENLRIILNSTIPYIGMLGPKERSTRILNELKAEGLKVDESRIYAPVGLDIGATSPEEISLSIVAEIKAFFASRNGGHLRDRQSPINDRNPAKSFK
ncbi:Xanthine and CO dehydrogenase maturation factor, XdhC/CoxF family [Spirosomataceae bacterium TFI 002]|nr:Xanthine and CO dehydrogenase maturation factor, XdhC/CoxF family [Spirosomataceae bacterium TFI 002]